MEVDALDYIIGKVLSMEDYDLSSVLNKRHTLVLSNTRELDRVPTTD